jgi:signal recognition particle receptor subunit beta
MAELSSERAEVNARILYWGAEGAGKSANLAHVHRKLRPDHRGDLQRTPTALDPTVEVESLPISLGELAGRQVQLQIVAVPGAPEHAPTRKQLLDRADGVVLVVDASPDRIDANLESFDELRRALSAYGRSLDELPLVVQYNKRDQADELTLEDLHKKLDLQGVAAFEAVATEGKGVLQALTTISKRVIKALRESGLGGMEDAPAAPRAPAPPPPPPPEPLLEPEPAPAQEAEPLPEPLELEPVEAGLAAEERDPAAAAQAEAVAQQTEGAFAESFGALTAPVTAPAAGLPAGLRLDAVGTPRQAGDRALVVPLVLRDADDRPLRVELAITLDLRPVPGGD